MREDGLEAAPRKVVVIGAGIVGLSTAWFLQSRGVEVEVVERDAVAAGASWGNAGYVSPGFASPLPEPGLLGHGLHALFDSDAPLYVPFAVDPGLWSFLARFAAHCTTRRWNRSMRSYAVLNEQALDAFETLGEGGVDVPVTAAPITAAFEERSDVVALRAEFARMAGAGQHVRVEELSPSEAGIPQLSPTVGAVLRIDGQRFVDPGALVTGLAGAVRARGGVIRTGVDVATLRQSPGEVVLKSRAGERMSADAVVVATGAWLSTLARPLGVRTEVRAGRGYSFTVPTEEAVPGPVYLSAAKVACTPYQGALRVAGTMEFRSPEAALDSARIEAIVRSARPYLTGVSWADRKDEWVGSRPVTADGLPLVGASRMPGVYVAGGHGMWGLTLGPLTGRLLADQMVSGAPAPELRSVDPLR